MHNSLLHKTLLALVAASSLATAAYAQSPLGDLSASGTVGFESQYVFRGKKITDAAMQPKGEFGIPVFQGQGDIYAGVWSNDPVSRRGTHAGPDQLSEIDLFGGFIYTLPGGFRADLGNTYYWYPEDGGVSVPTAAGPRLSRTDETYFGVTYDTTSLLKVNLSPSLYYYHDWFLDSDVVEISAKYVWDVSRISNINGLSIVPELTAGWDNTRRMWGDQTNLTSIDPTNPTGNWHDSWCYWMASVELDYAVSDFCKIYLNASYAGNNDGTGLAPYGAITGENAQNGGTQTSVWAGGGLKFAR
jgi:uncharacterized protein (TIGR02001 family)